MADTGYLYPSSVINSANGATAWSNPGNAVSDDGVFTSADLDQGSSDFLFATGYGATVPAGATIDGILLEIKRKSIQTGEITDDRVKLMKTAVSLSVQDKADTVTQWPTVSEYAVYGGATDKWLTTWTENEINASTFGVRIEAKETGVAADTAYIDVPRIKIFYTGGTPAPALTVTGTADNGTYGFGPVPVNTVQSRQFTITNTGSAGDTLGTLTISGTGFSIDAADDPSGDTLAVSATATVTVIGNFATAGSKTGILTIPSNDAASPYVVNLTASPMSAAITGTATASITEADIVAGGKTIIITLTNDTWVAAGATFDAQRQAIINGIDSAQAEATGWDAVVKATQGVAGVVRTSATVVTITLDAQATYDITATETITVTVPSAALTGAGGAVVASPTFTVTAASSGYEILALIKPTNILGM